jgi:hypothetical protein
MKANHDNKSELGRQLMAPLIFPLYLILVGMFGIIALGWFGNSEYNKHFGK